MIQLFLAGQVALFAFGAAAHAGIFTDMNDLGAAIAETVIAGALLAGLSTTFRAPQSAASAGLA